MALLTELTTQNKTDIRADGYRVIQFLCTVPNTLVVQFTPDAEPTNAVYASITVGTVGSGSMSDILEGQTVIYSTTTDYQQTETFRTRVRKVDGTTVLYVAENSQGLTTSMYVTVIDTYEVHEKLQRSATYRDWDITFRRLLPIETALPSALVLTNDVVSYDSVAAPVVMDNDASSISSHAWTSSNSNDSFDDATIAQPTITLEAEAFRWLRYTFTDDLGQSNYRVIPCWTVPKDYSASVTAGFGGASGDYAAINFDPELGWDCSISAFTGIENLLNKTLCVIACDEFYNSSRQSIRTNINFVGYLQNESTNTSGDEQYGKLSETTFTIEGFGHQLARQNISGVRITRTASPTAWGDIENPTPARMLTYHLSEGSTILNLCSLTIPSDDGDFIGDDLSITNGKALDDIRFISDVVNAELQFDCDGRLDLCRNLVYLDDTARDAADEVVEILQSDTLSHSLSFDYGYQTSTLEMAGGAFDSTNNVYDLYRSIAPSVARLSEGDPVKITNQVLETDATAAEAKTELGERAANYFAANQPNYMLDVTFKPAWWFLVPDVGAWFTFPFVEADTARGKVFSSNDRWQLVSISHSTNRNTGTREVQGTFRLETQSTGAMVLTTTIQNDSDADILYLPAAFAPFLGGDLGLTGGNWYDTQDTAPPSDANPPEEDCELGGFRPKSGVGYETSTPALNGEVIKLTVRGSGIIKEGTSDSATYDFTSGAESWAGVTNSESAVAGDARPKAGEGAAGSISGSGWVTSDFEQQNTTDARALYVYIELGSPITLVNGSTVTATFDYTKGNVGSGFTAWELKTKDSGGTWTRRDHVLGSGTSDDTDLTLDWTASSTLDIHGIAVWLRTDSSASPTGSALLKSVAVVGEGEIRGDAFYYSVDGGTWQAYGSGDGFLFKGSQPSSIPPYSANHEYTIYETVTSGVIATSFNSPYSLSLAENWSIQELFCFLGVP